MFTDVIRTADSEHEIYFLLTSYIEVVRDSRPPHPMPEHITRLPLNGVTDLRQRFEQLVPELDAASRRLDDKAVALIKQARHAFGTALDRLLLLEKVKTGMVEAARSNPVTADHVVPPAANSRGPLEILLVEDNPADVRMTREALQVAGVAHHLHVVADGADALSFLCRSRHFDNAPKPDLVLLDMNIPRLNGRRVLGEIKSRNDLRQIPVVLLASSGAEHDMHNRIGMRADHFMTKPAGLQAFVREIKKIEALAHH